MTNQVAERATQLAAQGLPFVRATVVRAQVPASAKAGDSALVLPDGTIEGFVGGTCTEGSVRSAALASLLDGDPVLLRVLPDDYVSFPETPGARLVVNPCLSGGAVEIFLEPVLPAPRVAVLGSSPVADAVVLVAGTLGYEASRAAPDDDLGGASAVVVATHGRDEERAIRAALDVGVGYIGLVASRRRGAAVLDDLDLTDAERARISTPAGLDIGARTAPEIALSILAEIVTALRRGGLTAPHAPEVPVPVQVIDPVCGMTVTVAADTPFLDLGGERVHFCGTGCRDRYAEQSGGDAGSGR